MDDGAKFRADWAKRNDVKDDSQSWAMLVGVRCFQVYFWATCLLAAALTVYPDDVPTWAGSLGFGMVVMLVVIHAAFAMLLTMSIVVDMGCDLLLSDAVRERDELRAKKLYQSVKSRIAHRMNHRFKMRSILNWLSVAVKAGLLFVGGYVFAGVFMVCAVMWLTVMLTVGRLVTAGVMQSTINPETVDWLESTGAKETT